MKTKIKFTDIQGMLERDEMREITGACGNACCTGPGTGRNNDYFTGAGDFSTGLATFASMGFGGVSAIGSTYGGQPYNMNNNPFNALPRNNSYGSSNYNSGNGSPTDCVFQCMAQVAAFLGNPNFSINAMKTNYDSIYKVAIFPSNGNIGSAANGVNEIVFSNFVDQYFNRAALTTKGQLDNFISAGGDNFAIGVIRKYNYNGTESMLHAVILTGKEGEKYTYTDPQNGGVFSSVGENSLVSFVAITGVCP